MKANPVLVRYLDQNFVSVEGHRTFPSSHARLSQRETLCDGRND